ncbi:GL18293 [Drosophila persimilis]|uniref:Decapping nuclease n=1 Tax=Drosophila persimilis TaxID=7234 RepID=B4H4N1_DROPE|nr:decapping nuclease DXO homolog [Drosophila persimilis]EDW32643.1 GL18293 [Drosophila persimilis]
MAHARSNDVQRLHVDRRLHKLGRTYRHSFPKFSHPECIGFFSINSQQEFEDNSSGASYLWMPPKESFPLDLKAGYERVIRKIEKTGIDDLANLLKYIYNHQQLLTPTESKSLALRADFVACRGVLRLLMCMPYETRDDFCVRATRLNGTIYIAKIQTDQQREEKVSMTEHSAAMCSWGFKFEQYMSSPVPNTPPDTSLPVNEAVEFNAMFRCSLQGMRLLYGAEMDGIVSRNPVNFNDPEALKNLQFVEFKTGAFEAEARQQRSFNFCKSRTWWGQSFLVGVKTIMVGLRDGDGICHDIVRHDVAELARNKPWSPTAMFKFLEQFLKELKKLLEAINDPQTVVELEFLPHSDSVYYRVLTSPEDQIIPEWYRTLMKGGA